MVKFKATVTRNDEYIIEFDEERFNEQWMKEFRDIFYDFDSLEEHAEHVAQFRARFSEEYIEGYGAPLVNGREPIFHKGDTVEQKLNIQVISEDEEIEVDVQEIE